MTPSVFRTAATGIALALALAGGATAAFAQTPEPSAEGQAATQPAQAQDPAGGQAAPEGETGDRVVATVNGAEIRESEVAAAIQNLPAQVRQMPREMLIPLVADQLATGKLIADRAYEAGVQNDEAVKQQLADAERRIVQQVWLDRQIEEQMTDQRVEQAYQDYVEANPAQEEVHASHILVETEEEANEIITALDEGGDFAELARERSKDPGASDGGDLGFFTKEQMVEPFAEAAFNLQPGEISEEPVQTQFGWHVIKVQDRRTQEQPSLDELRPQLEQTVQRDIVQSLVADLREGAEITIYGPDGEPLPSPEAGEAPASAGGQTAPAQGNGAAAE